MRLHETLASRSAAAIPPGFMLVTPEYGPDGVRYATQIQQDGLSEHMIRDTSQEEQNLADDLGAVRVSVDFYA
jgi:hypothetical protein